MLQLQPVPVVCDSQTSLPGEGIHPQCMRVLCWKILDALLLHCSHLDLWHSPTRRHRRCRVRNRRLLNRSRIARLHRCWPRCYLPTCPIATIGAENFDVAAAQHRLVQGCPCPFGFFRRNHLHIGLAFWPISLLCQMNTIWHQTETLEELLDVSLHSRVRQTAQLQPAPVTLHWSTMANNLVVQCTVAPLHCHPQVFLRSPEHLDIPRTHPLFVATQCGVDAFFGGEFHECFPRGTAVGVLGEVHAIRQHVQPGQERAHVRVHRHVRQST
mmetsp:Transcript_5220/g.32835  ORF Transcript_5220/g.32835 Transcript_5220/m.32835 type:complete len:270 (-) Transcript_5220:654-1463(-)